MLYRLELRRMGEVLRSYETENRKAARLQAQKWHEKTFDTVVILFIDGKEVRLKDTAKKLGIKGAGFDSLKRYQQREPLQHILRRTGFSKDGRVRHKPTIDDGER